MKQEQEQEFKKLEQEWGRFKLENTNIRVGSCVLARFPPKDSKPLGYWGLVNSFDTTNQIYQITFNDGDSWTKLHSEIIATCPA